MAQIYTPLHQGMSRTEWQRLADGYARSLDRARDTGNAALIAARERELAWAVMQAENATH